MNGYRLLVVEDDAALCESIADVLRFTGYEVETAPDGDSALEALRAAARPDAILLDLVLPRMSAERLLDGVAAAAPPRPPVVLMTGMSRGAAGRPPGVLMKPFDVDELLARIAEACGSAEAPRGCV